MRRTTNLGIALTFTIAVTLGLAEPVFAQFGGLSKSFSDFSKQSQRTAQQSRRSNYPGLTTGTDLQPSRPNRSIDFNAGTQVRRFQQAPSPPSSSSSPNINWFGVGQEIGKALSQPSNNQQWGSGSSHQPRPTYQPRQVYSTPRTYSAPATPTPRPVIKPLPTLAKNLLPEPEMEPTINSFTALNLADDAQLQQTAQDLSDEAIKDADKLAQDQHDKLAKDAEALINNSPASAKDKEEFLKAFNEGDVNKLAQAAKDIGLSDAQIDKLVQDVEMAQSLDHLAELVGSGASAEEIAQVSDGLIEHLSTQPGAESLELQEELSNINTKVEAHDVLIAAIGNQGMDTYPPGMTDVLSTPGLPDGCVAVTPDGQMIQGTGGEGELGFEQETVADVMGMPVPEEAPVPDLDDDSVQGVASGIVLISAKKNRGDIQYRADGHDYTMKPGYRQELSAGRSHAIEFDRGGEFGPAKYSLEEGTYGFEVTPKGWELYRQSFRVTIDNSENRHEFAYLVNGEHAVAEAKGTKQHTSDFALAVSFDRGDGGEPGQKRLKSGVYRVGLDIENRRIDLFPVDEAPQTAGKSPKPDALGSARARPSTMAQAAE